MKGDEPMTLHKEAERVGATDFYIQPGVFNGVELVENKYTRGRYEVHFIGHWNTIDNLKADMLLYKGTFDQYTGSPESERPTIYHAIKTKGFMDSLLEGTVSNPPPS